MIQKNNICQQPSLSNKHDSIVKISMCSINVCGLNSKLKYGILQDHIIYIYIFDLICLTETKCDSLIGYDIDGYKSYFKT